MKEHNKNILNLKLQDSFEICVLICFLLNELGALTEKLLLEIVTLDETVSVFNLSDALGLSENKNLIERFNKDNKIYYKVSAAGKEILYEFVNSLPLLIREKMLAEGRKVLSLFKLKKAVNWNICEAENGYYFKVQFLNEMGGDDIMQIKIFAPSMESALDIENRFLKKPVDIIGNVLNMFIMDSYL